MRSRRVEAHQCRALAPLCPGGDSARRSQSFATSVSLLYPVSRVTAVVHWSQTRPERNSPLVQGEPLSTGGHAIGEPDVPIAVEDAAIPVEPLCHSLDVKRSDDQQCL